MRPIIPTRAREIVLHGPHDRTSFQRKANPVNIDKDQIIGMLRGQGDHDQADQAAQQLPDQVDTDNADMLSKSGLNLDSIKGKLGGLGGLLK
jgi:hypothetical protein